jgi:mutual gliding-motility protein MglA
MSFVNFEKKEINFKVVYYGPPMGGKTSNLAYLHDVMPAAVRGDLTMLSTQHDRTLYFDFLPLQSNVIKGFISRFQLYTVPGQPIYDRTRRIVLTGSDGVVFVADSQWAQMTANAESLENLQANLRSHGRSLESLPHLFQLNKRDLEDLAPAAYMEFLLNRGPAKADCVEAVAVKGIGVARTLNTICKMVLAQFIEEHNMKVDVVRQPQTA